MIEHVQNFRKIRLKKNFFAARTTPDNFFKILFRGDMVINDTYLCIEFHGRRSSSLRGVGSQRNHRNGRIRASLAPLTPLNETYIKPLDYTLKNKD